MKYDDAFLANQMQEVFRGAHNGKWHGEIQPADSSCCRSAWQYLARWIQNKFRLPTDGEGHPSGWAIEQAGYLVDKILGDLNYSMPRESYLRVCQTVAWTLDGARGVGSEREVDVFNQLDGMRKSRDGWKRSADTRESVINSLIGQLSELHDTRKRVLADVEAPVVAAVLGALRTEALHRGESQ